MKTPNDDIQADHFDFENAKPQAMHDDIGPLIEKARAAGPSDRSRNDLTGALYGLRGTLRQVDARERKK